eukprot:207712_1
MEVVNPVARLQGVYEIKTDQVIDQIVSVKPQIYNPMSLQSNEFLIVVNLQYHIFKKSIVAYNIIDLDVLEEHKTEPAYRLLSKFLQITGEQGDAKYKLDML